MSTLKKLIVAGVGGQGVTYTVRLLMNAAVLADIKVSTDEIHGLSQRGGVVNAGLTFGESGHGYVDAGEADFLVGLEKLEAQRCLGLLNANSRVVIDNIQLVPFTVNAGASQYPETEQFIEKLRAHIAEVVFVGEEVDISPKLRTYFLLGILSMMQGFPIKGQFIEQAIQQIARKNSLDESLEAFKDGRAYLNNH